jgi:hypothetical protein
MLEIYAWLRSKRKDEMRLHIKDSARKTKSIKRLIWVALAISLFLLLVIFYVIPNTFGQLFVSNAVAPVIYCDQVMGVLLTSHNSYFIPVTLSYKGADAEIDVLNSTTGTLIYEANFLSEELHDEEEGVRHVAQIQTGTTKFLLSFTESSQYYSSGGKLPVLPYKDIQRTASQEKPEDSISNKNESSYYLNGTAFGLLVDSTGQGPFVIPASNNNNAADQGISGSEKNTSLPGCNSKDL